MSEYTESNPISKSSKHGQHLIQMHVLSSIITMDIDFVTIVPQLNMASHYVA